MSITLRQLQVFIAVAGSENLTSAADQLGLSKSAVSQALSELESRLGVSLFDRTRGRMLLSAEGRRMKPYADELLRRSQDLVTLFNRKSKGELHVAVTQSVGTFLLGDLLTDFYRQYGWIPDVTVQNNATTADMLTNFSVDAAIVEGPVFSRELITTPWLSDELIVISAKDHPLVGQGPVSWQRLSQERWILREPGSSNRVYFESQLALRLTHPRILAVVNSYDAVFDMIMNGLGITFVSKRVLSNPFFKDHFAQIECPERFSRELAFAINRQKYVSADIDCWQSFCLAWAENRIRTNPVEAGYAPGYPGRV